MHLSTYVATLLCAAVSLVTGGVLPLPAEGSLQSQRYPQLYAQYALLVPLTDSYSHGGVEDSQQPDVLTSTQQQEALPGRVRRQLVSGGVTRESGGGTRVDAGLSGTLYQNGPHTVRGNGHAERTYGIPGVGNGPFTYGGGVNYDHASRGGAGVDLTRTPMGTQVTAQGQGTLWQSRDRNGRIDAHGSYSRTYGGPYGSSRPNYGAGVTYTHRF